MLHLLYTRFWHKLLFALGHVSTPEPFQRLYNQGYILADAFTDTNGRYVPAAKVTATDGGLVHEGQPVRRRPGKMSKSLKNAIAPDEIYDSYSADTSRMYEMAMGPLDVDRPWQPDDIMGVFRLLQRPWRNIVDEQTGELTNAPGRYVQRHGASPHQVAQAPVQMVFPLAPHVASELWEKLGHDETIDDVPFPTADPDTLAQTHVVLPVTVNEKPRGEITVNQLASQAEVTEAGLALEAVAKLVEGKETVRVVVVPGKIVNFVIR